MITVFIRHKRVLLSSMMLAGVLVSDAQTVLDQYIKEAIDNNIVVKQKNISLDKARLALDIAKSYYYPTVAFQAGYQTAQGGRDIQLPLGDLLNGVYSTLNTLTGSNNFPQLENQSVNFLPRNFYDARIRTTVPIYNADIGYNKKIAEQQVVISQLDLDIYKRELIRNTKEAYFNYLLALEGVQIYEQALSLADEGKRVNQSLLDNGKGLPAYLIRSEAEVESLQAEINRAVQNMKNAQVYFNFLLNRDLQAPIDTNYNAGSELQEALHLLTKEENVSNREEIQALEQAKLINETLIKLRKSAYYPRLGGFLDLGSQAENFKFNKQSRYYMVGLQLDIPVFSGFRIKNSIRQAEMDLANGQLNQDMTRKQLSMAGSVARNNLDAALHTLKAKEKQLDAAATYQRLIERGYREGSNTFIETIDARNQYTQAQLSYKIQLYQVLAAAANLERTLALDNLK